MCSSSDEEATSPMHAWLFFSEMQNAIEDGARNKQGNAAATRSLLDLVIEYAHHHSSINCQFTLIQHKYIQKKDGPRYRLRRGCRPGRIGRLRFGILAFFAEHEHEQRNY